VPRRGRRKRNAERECELNTIVLHEARSSEAPLDVYQDLSENRILFITGQITGSLATDISATLLLKSFEDPEGKITIIISSEGGSIRNAFMIYDMMQTISCPIEIICVGVISNEAILVLAGGTPGMRLATKNVIISVSQLENNYVSQVNMTNVNKIMKMTDEDNKRMMTILAKAVKKPLKKVMSDFDRRVFFDSAKAMKYGLVDRVITYSK